MNLLITGASRGLGKEWVIQALKRPEFKKIYAVSRNAKEMRQWLPKHDPDGKVEVLPLAVDNDACITELREALEGEAIDLLINNAGTYLTEPEKFENYTIDLLRKTFEVNTYAPFRVTQALLSHLSRAKHPKVVHITSLMGSIADNASGGSYAYRMSKTALNMFNKSFAIDHPKIASIVLHPGWVKTDMGGASAPTTVTESVAGMWKIVEKLDSKITGKFFDFEGDELPW